MAKDTINTKRQSEGEKLTKQVACRITIYNVLRMSLKKTKQSN